uniref:Putative aldo-keto reductase family protein n=1 Tax=viral metagenome TaxID=1070528 RepID=A0A6M3JMS9_9ZZZZ
MIYTDINGLQISKIGLGGAMYESLSLSEGINISGHAFSKYGINYFDGHQNYGFSETGLRTMKEIGANTVVSTKSRAYHSLRDIHTHAVKSSNWADIYFMSNIDTVDCYEQLISIHPTISRLRAEGKFKAIGMTCHHKSPIIKALNDKLDVDVFLFPFNLIRKECAEVFSRIRDAGKKAFVMKVLSAGENLNDIPLKNWFDFICQWKDEIDSLLLGVKSIQELDEDMELLQPFLE